MSEEIPKNPEEGIDIGGWIVPEGKEPHPVVWEAGEQAHSLIDQGNYEGAEQIILDLLKTDDVSKKFKEVNEEVTIVAATDVLHDLVVNEAENEKDAMRMEVNDILTKVNDVLYPDDTPKQTDDGQPYFEEGE